MVEKAYRDGCAPDKVICFARMSAGPIDYTSGAMDELSCCKYPSSGEKGDYTNPGSIWTHCRQVAMMTLYVHATKMAVRTDKPMPFRMVPGGGIVMRFSKKE